MASQPTTLPTLLRVENYAIWLSRIKYAISSLDAGHLVLTVAIVAEDKKLQKRAIGLVVSKIGDGPLQVIQGIETLKGVLERLSEQHAEKG